MSGENIIKGAGAVLSCLCFLPSPGFAAPQAGATAGDGIEEIVITATKTRSDRTLVPQDTEVVTQQDFRRWGAVTVRDALQHVTGLNLTPSSMQGQSSRVTSQVSMRGMGNKGTLILVDGRRLAGEDSPEAINGYELNRLNLHEIDRIEIVKGASSALYGSDAMGGVIQIFTKRPEKGGSYAGVDTGSGESSVYGGFATGREGKLSLGVNFDVTRVRADDAAGYSNQFGPKRFLSLNGQYRFSNTQGIDFGASFLREQYREFLGASQEWFDDNRSDYYIRYHGDSGKNHYEVLASYNRLGKSSRTESRGGSPVDFDHAVYETYTVDARDTYRASAGHTLTFGSEYRHQKAGGTRIGHGISTRTERTYGLTKTSGEDSYDTYAFYGQDEWRLSDRLFFVPSLRYDHFEDFGSELSPRAGLTCVLNPHLRIRTNYGLAYRIPTIFERYADMEHSVRGMRISFVGNEDLDAERSRTFDIGIEGEWGRGRGRLTYFHNTVHDRIETTFLGRRGRNLFYTCRNIDKAVLDGVEAEFRYAFDRHFSARASYTYLDGRNEATGGPLLGSARATGLCELSYTDGKTLPFTASLFTQWNDHFVTGENKPYTYSTTNLALSRELPHGLRVYAGIDNLFNKTFSSSEDFAIPGREWRVGMEWKW